jgi:hypothetical protein
LKSKRGREEREKVRREEEWTRGRNGMEIKREIRIRNEKDQISGRGLRSNHICNS